MSVRGDPFLYSLYHRSMWNIAGSVFRELIRDRILSIIAVFGVVLIFFSLALSALSIGARESIIVDFSLSMIEIVSLIVVIFVGSQVLFREIEGRTIYLILSKPISRRDFLLGKMFGFALILAIIVGVEGVFASILIGITAPSSFTWFIPVAIIATYLKLIILFAIILFFSTFVSPMIAILASVGVYFAGHASYDITDLARISHNTFMYYLGETAAVVFPNFEALNIKGFIHAPDIITKTFPVLDFHIPYLLINTLYVFLYLAIILALAIAIFEKRTFER